LLLPDGRVTFVPVLEEARSPAGAICAPQEHVIHT
jgi:hypothetical protein